MATMCGAVWGKAAHGALICHLDQGHEGAHRGWRASCAEDLYEVDPTVAFDDSLVTSH